MAATEHAAGEARRTRQPGAAREEPPPAGAGSNPTGSEPGHHPRDPFAAGSQRALEALNAEWKTPYILSYHGGLYLARRREGPPGPVMSGETPGEIARELSRDWGETP